MARVTTLTCIFGRGFPKPEFFFFVSFPVFFPPRFSSPFVRPFVRSFVRLSFLFLFVFPLSDRFLPAFVAFAALAPAATLGVPPRPRRRRRRFTRTSRTHARNSNPVSVASSRQEEGVYILLSHRPEDDVTKDKAEKQCAPMRVSTGSRVRVTVIQLRAFHTRRRGKRVASVATTRNDHGASVMPRDV